MPELNHLSPVPLYAQLAEHLLVKIRSRELEQGARIPSEHELAKTYGVGRPTVRQATETLLRRGYLERRRGSGTYVRVQREAVDLFSLGGTLSAFERHGLELEARILGPTELVSLPFDESHPELERQAYRVKRLGSARGQVVLLETFLFDAVVFPRFDQLALEKQSISELVYENYRMEPISADQRFRVEMLNKEHAKLLELREGEPILHVDRTLHFPSVWNAVSVEMRCRNDFYPLSQRITSPAGL